MIVRSKNLINIPSQHYVAKKNDGLMQIEWLDLGNCPQIRINFINISFFERPFPKDINDFSSFLMLIDEKKKKTSPIERKVLKSF